MEGKGRKVEIPLHQFLPTPLIHFTAVRTFLFDNYASVSCVIMFSLCPDVGPVV